MKIRKNTAIISNIEDLCKFMRTHNVTKMKPIKGIYKEDLILVEYCNNLTEDDIDELEELVEEDA